MLQLKPWNLYPLRVVHLSSRHLDFVKRSPAPPSHVDSLFSTLSDPAVKELWMVYNQKKKDGSLPEPPLYQCAKCILDPLGEDAKRSAKKSPPFLCSCGAAYHIRCIASCFMKAAVHLPTGETVASLEGLMPVQGRCPCCNEMYTWGQVLRMIADRDRELLRRARAPGSSAATSPAEEEEEEDALLTGDDQQEMSDEENDEHISDAFEEEFEIFDLTSPPQARAALASEQGEEGVEREGEENEEEKKRGERKEEEVVDLT
mmetsp:Transcript_8999/g.30012  ORF Transcript_8999/g.30012 Transcript_8999/m.30012 type:complete len:260 (-) Transcript_8999:2570-3349(-)